MNTAKAWVGFAASLTGALATALADNVWNADDATQVTLAVVTGLSVLYTVWRTPNREAING